MLGMNEPSQLYEESNDVQMDLMPGKSDLLQMQVGSGSREPSPNPRTGALPQLDQDGPKEEEAAQPTAEPQGDRGLANRPSSGE